MSVNEINLHSTMDAQVWAKEFMRLFGGKLDYLEEGLMMGWFANAIMAGYDTAMQRQPDFAGIREVYEKYKHLDDVISDTRWLPGADFKYHIMASLWQAVKGVCKEGK